MDPVSHPDKERNQYIQVYPERKEVKVVRGEEAKWGKKQLSVKVKAAAYLQPTGRGKRKKYKELEKKIPPKKINCLCP